VVNVVSIAGLAAAAVSWFAIAIPFVVVVTVVIQRFYVKTSKQLRLLEFVSQMPKSTRRHVSILTWMA
jgi:Flp pilus assembly protein TadB